MAVTEQKKAIVAQMKETLSEAKGAVLIGYSGLTVAQATDLRRKMLAEGVEYKVIKNTLTRIAANELNLEGFAEHLEGPTALATSKDDAVAPARVIEQFIKATEQEVVTVNEEKAMYWLSNGAIPTDTVRSILSKQGIMKKFAESKKAGK